MSTPQDIHVTRTETTAELIETVMHHGRAVVLSELDLAKQELSRAGTRLTRAGILFGSAFLLVLVAFHALAVAGVLGLMALGLPGWAAASLTTLAVIALALICALVGKSQLTSKAMTPHRTLSQLKTDYSALKESFRAS